MNRTRAALGMILTLLFASSAYTPAQLTETHSFTGLNRPVPEGDASGIHDVRLISSDGQRLSSVKQMLREICDYNAELYAYLRHISGANCKTPTGHSGSFE